MPSATKGCSCLNAGSSPEPGCGCAPPSGSGAGWCTGSIETPVGSVLQISGTLDAADRRGAMLMRLGLGRGAYRVDPGLYALGSPDWDSPVFVGANYKLSFDVLRSSLPGRNGWILVLDTAGVNVWCAAGKGTFGTDELVRRISATGLGSVVGHRRLIVPQLGATGVAAHLVQEASGFSVDYGPVRAADLPAFLDAGCQATPEMRRVRFGVRDRMVVVPTELVLWSPLMVPLIVGFACFGQAALASVLLGAFLSGAVLVPLLLPWLPGKAFSVKGMLLGLVLGLPVTLSAVSTVGGAAAAGLLGILVATTSFFALNFTGCTTFTSLSGTRYETLRAVPLQVLALLTGLALWWWA